MQKRDRKEIAEVPVPDSCPKCGLDFNNDDIYQHFLKEYTDNWPYRYAKTKEEIFEIIKNYPDQYREVPDNLESYSDIELNAWYTASLYGWTVSRPKCFRKEIGIEVQGYYDGVVLWMCPACRHTWKRFPWVSDEILEAHLKEAGARA